MFNYHQALILQNLHRVVSFLCPIDANIFFPLRQRKMNGYQGYAFHHYQCERSGFVLAESNECGMEGAVDQHFSQHHLDSRTGLWLLEEGHKSIHMHR